MKTTLKDLQNVLPIGYFTPSGDLLKTFQHRPWRMEEERLVGKIRENENYQTMGPFVSQLLATMITSIGSINLAEKSGAEKHLIFGQMYITDVLYMYSWLRRESLGPELLLVSTCVHCNKRQEIAADMDTLEVDLSEKEITSPDDLIKTIELKKGVTVQDQIYQEVIIRPNTWMAMETFTGKTAANDGAMKSKLFQDAVIAIPELERDHFVLTDEMMDTLFKVDIEIINKAIDELNGGLIMSVEHRCERCQRVYFQGIDWNYDNFFSHSSIPSATGS